MPIPRGVTRIAMFSWSFSGSGSLRRDASGCPWSIWARTRWRMFSQPTMFIANTSWLATKPLLRATMPESGSQIDMSTRSHTPTNTCTSHGQRTTNPTRRWCTSVRVCRLETRWKSKTTQLTKMNECLLRTNLKFTKYCIEKLEHAHGNLDNHKRTDIIGMQLVENRNVCFTWFALSTNSFHRCFMSPIYEISSAHEMKLGPYLKVQTWTWWMWQCNKGTHNSFSLQLMMKLKGRRFHATEAGTKRGWPAAKIRETRTIERAPIHTRIDCLRQVQTNTKGG